MYIKCDGGEANNKWEKDDENKKLRGALKKISRVQQKNLVKWTEEHPNWMNDEYLTKEREKYSAVWGPIDEKDKKNEKDLLFKRRHN